MAITESDLRAQADAALSAVLTQIAAGKTVTEWREGSIHVKRDTPAELIKALKAIRDSLDPGDPEQRQASVWMFRGAV